MFLHYFVINIALNFYLCQNFANFLSMKKYIFLTLVLLLTNFANAQFQVVLKTNQESEIVKTCLDSVVTFYAYGIFNGDTLKDLDFSWDFDDGYVVSEKNLDTIEHLFAEKKAYRIMVTASNSTHKGYDILTLEMGLAPDFYGTKVDLPAEQKGICKGESVGLIGAVKPRIWKEKRPTIYENTFPQFVDFSKPFSAQVLRRSFNVGDVFSADTDIEKIGLKIEHSNSQNLKIVLTCPSGKSLVLKDAGGAQKMLGEPVVDVDDFSEGQGYWYYWTNSPTYGKMSEYSGAEATLPSGDYAVEGAWSDLNGCPLNGQWAISVTDQTEDTDNGYCFAWELKFDQSVETELLEYSNEYDFMNSWWFGDQVNATSNGQSSAAPKSYGSHRYRLFVQDDFQCWHDTALFVSVEQPNFTMDKEPPSMVIGDSVKLEDKTSWATEWRWNFGDESDLGSSQIEYKKYEYSGVYKIVLEAVSESGCVDFDTASITITPQPVEVEKYNIFTPNGDGVNDVFKFFNKPDELIDAANIEKVQARIYNRNGDVVCKWTTPEEIIAGWDGTINNKGKRKAPAGMYYYVLIITNKEVDKKNKFVKQEPISGCLYLYRSK